MADARLQAELTEAKPGVQRLKERMSLGTPTVHKDLSLVTLVPKWSASESGDTLEEFFASIEGAGRVGRWQDADKVENALLKQEFTPISELRHIETLLQYLESKLHDFYQILPRLDRRRGLINLGGSILKTLFGTATNSDIYQLHDTLSNLQSQNSDTVHSLSDQLTFVKKRSAATEINVDAIANLSSIVKDNVVQSHEKFQHTY
jgi:hypothetical protein